MSYVQEVITNLNKKYSQQPEFIQAVSEVLLSLESTIKQDENFYRKHRVLERLIVPERIIEFKVTWIDDNQNIQVNTGYRIQHSSVLGPYKGGLRFHANVNQSVLKFLAFEQTFKNALTGLPLGGAKGGSDFDPKDKSDTEIMNFCQHYMSELYKYIGPNIDIPAGDIGVGAKEIGYLFGHYKKLTNRFEGVLTSKGLSYGGSLGRTEATGYGVIYMLEEVLKQKNDKIENKVIGVSGSGNVAIHAIEKALELRAKVVTASDSNGWILDNDGIDLGILKEIKLKKRQRLSEYVNHKPSALYFSNNDLWKTPVDVFIPCATQNEVTLDDAIDMVTNKVKLVIEGANMPLTNEAVGYLQSHGVVYVPGKASNSGGVLVSGYEMSQNASKITWSFEEVDSKLREKMIEMVKDMNRVMDPEYPNNYLKAANVLGFKKLAEALISQGV
ncbi:MAG: NADP-specific glutamate dehydrogenase [Erysipelothrix sp.]|nr:NADP-specific glutamate dehydrogenase [Erysipelothrix sp.]